MTQGVPVSRASIALLVCWLAGCGFALQRAGVSQSFQARFGCPVSTMRRVSDGYHVEGCGRSAEYVCFRERDDHDELTPSKSAAGLIASALFVAAFSGSDERCVLASSERSSAAPVHASDAPSHVGRVRAKSGRELLKSRVLFAGGHLRALAAPRDHPEHVLMVVHSVVQMEDAPCRSALFHDGVELPIVEQAREGRYEARLVVSVSGLSGLENAVRFAGEVCGTAFELDPSARATLGLFAARFREERARIAREVGSEAAPALAAQIDPAPAPAAPGSLPEPATAEASAPPVPRVSEP